MFAWAPASACVSAFHKKARRSVGLFIYFFSVKKKGLGIRISRLVLAHVSLIEPVKWAGKADLL